jgi:hypothetical protein
MTSDRTLRFAVAVWIGGLVVNFITDDPIAYLVAGLGMLGVFVALALRPD